MSRTIIATGLLLTVLAAGGCATSNRSSGAGPDGPEPVTAAPTTEAAPLSAAEPFLAASYPTPADADAAFVSEVAGIQGVRSFLVRTPFILPADLTAASAGLAQRGRDVCASYHGDDLDAVVADLRFSTGVDGTVDVMDLDEIDATAFAVAAVGVYCPRELADLGEGIVMTGGIEIREVTPACPTVVPVTVAADPVQLTGQSNAEMYEDFGEDNDLVYGNTDGLYDGAWSYTLTNSSGYDVLVAVEEQVTSEWFTTEWAAPTAGPYSAGPLPPFLVPAHGTVTGTGTISGVYAWQSASYRVASWMPLSCQVSLQ